LRGQVTAHPASPAIMSAPNDFAYIPSFVAHGGLSNLSQVSSSVDSLDGQS